MPIYNCTIINRNCIINIGVNSIKFCVINYDYALFFTTCNVTDVS